MAFACALVLAAVTFGGSSAPQESALVRQEAFVLEQVDALTAGDAWALLGAPARREGGNAGEQPEELGLLLWRRSESAGVLTLEWDLRFHESQTRVIEVERYGDHGSTLVYRELQPRSGRTLSADRVDEASALRLREWGGPNLQQSMIESVPGARFRLGLLEDLREAVDPPTSASVFDPLSRSFEHLVVAAEQGPAEGPWSGARLIRISRADGTSGGNWLLRDGLVVGFQLQAGGLRARRIGLDEYEQRVTEREAHRKALEKGTDGPEQVPGPADSK